MDNDQATLTDQDVNVNNTEDTPSIDDTIRATLNSIKERDAVAAEELTGESATANRVRGADGKFAKALQDEAVTTVAAPAEGAPAEQSTEQAEQVPTARAPASWTAAAKAEFLKASPVIQQEVLRREQLIHDGIAQYKEAANYGTTLQTAIAPYEQTIRQLGLTPDAAVGALLGADHKLRYGAPAEKLQYLHQLAQAYNIDISQGLPEQPRVDPNIQYFQNELQSTKQQLNQFLTAQKEREQADLNRELAQAKQGKPHFDELGQEIGALLQAALNRGEPITIDQAYEAALYASPLHRQELLSKQIEEKLAEDAKKRAEEAQKAQIAAKAAKAASVTNVAKRGTLQAQKAVGTMDDTIREKLREINSR